MKVTLDLVDKRVAVIFCAIEAVRRYHAKATIRCRLSEDYV